VIDFMAGAVRGVDTIDVRPAVREAWRGHLVAALAGVEHHASAASVAQV
jgi:hypothetical protein